MTPDYSDGVFLYGERETVFATDQRWEVQGNARQAKKRMTEIETATDMSTEQVRVTGGRTVRCDAGSERIERDVAATKLLMRPYRTPYKRPYA